jgi:hypothetical protein
MIRGPVKGGAPSVVHGDGNLQPVCDRVHSGVEGISGGCPESYPGIAAREGVEAGRLMIQSYRSGSIVALEVSQLLGELQIRKSNSRLRVSNDKPYSESKLKTPKYRQESPELFGNFQEAREFIRSLMA